MEDSYSPSKTHFVDPDLTTSPMKANPSKSLYPHFFFKSLIILFIIILLPLFPSQPPEFLNKSILTKHWELVHLLFIGIVVCYGLFSTRRNSPMNIEFESRSNVNTTQSYLSGISHVSSIFEDGFGNLGGSDDKRVIQSWNNQYFQSEFTNGRYVLDECRKSGSYNADHVFEQLPKPNPKSSSGYKPLGLPIRSLRSRVVDSDNPEPINAGGSSSRLKGSSKGVDKINKEKVSDYPEPINVGGSGSRLRGSSKGVDNINKEKNYDNPEPINLGGFSSRLKGSSKGVDKVNKEKVRGLVSTNLEDKFEETVVPSPIPWGSRSFRMEMREELGTIKPAPSHSRPFSVGEFEFESLKSQSFRLPKASHTSSKDSSSMFSSLSTVSPELPNPKTKDTKREKGSHGSSLQASRPSIVPSDGKASFVSSNIRRFSVGASSEMNAKRGFKDNLKDFSKGKIWDYFAQGNQVMDSLNSDTKCDKFEALSKGKSRGKSVRTIRPSETFLEAMKTEEVCPIRIDNKVETQCEKLESVSMGKHNLDSLGFKSSSTFLNYGKGERQVLVDGTIVESERETKSEKVETQCDKLESISVGIQNLDNLGFKSNPALLKYRKGERQVLADGTIVESERESESDFDNFQASSDEEKGDQEPDSGEVDKKASEFIAKFKEQIRLQKFTSVKGF